MLACETRGSNGSLRLMAVEMENLGGRQLVQGKLGGA